MSLDLHKEYPEPNEPEVIEKMVKLVLARMKPQDGRVRRGQHAKITGGVSADFTVREDLPANLRHGIFRDPGRTFRAIVRFSNAPESIESDIKGTGRGMAIKLLDVDDASAIPGADPGCQDFLLVNHPVFPFGTPEVYMHLFDIRDVPIAGDALAIPWLAIFHKRALEIVKEIRGKIVASPLQETYWSESPYWLGPSAGTDGGQAVKYSARPRSGKTALPKDPKENPDYLSDALARHLRTGKAAFDFKVQVQTDPVGMPIEDTSIVWDESLSVPELVATLTIGVQDVDLPEGKALIKECEAKAFSPWNALAEHRPMGGINRLRKAVYLASRDKRAGI